MKPWSFFPNKETKAAAKKIAAPKYKEIRMSLKHLGVAMSCGVLGMNELIKSSFFPGATGDINYLIDYSFHFSEWYSLIHQNKEESLEVNLDIGVDDEQYLQNLTVSVVCKKDNTNLPSYDEVYNDKDIVRNIKYDYASLKSAVSLALCVMLSDNPDTKLDLNIEGLIKDRIFDLFYEEMLTNPSLTTDSVEQEMTLGFMLSNIVRDIKINPETKECIIEVYDVSADKEEEKPDVKPTKNFSNLN